MRWIFPEQHWPNIGSMLAKGGGVLLIAQGFISDNNPIPVCSGGRWFVWSNHRLLVQHPHRGRRRGAWERWGQWWWNKQSMFSGRIPFKLVFCWICMHVCARSAYDQSSAPSDMHAWFALIIDHHRANPFGFILPPSLSSLACIACLWPWEGWTSM